MKNTLTILSLVVLVWGCAKKMTPVKSEAPPPSNTGSVSSASTINTGSTTTITPATNTQSSTTTAAGGVAGSRGGTTTMSAENAALQAGQSTFNAKCGRCHGLKVTTDYTDLRWVEILQVMAPRANLSETEKANVLAYVRANAKK